MENSSMSTFVAMEDLTTMNMTTNWSRPDPNVTRPLMPIADPMMSLFRQVCEVWISLPIAMLGIIGNILAFVVLCKQQRLTTTVLLQALAITDSLVLVSSILLRSMRYVGWDDFNDTHHYIFVALYPCVYFFRLADTWLTVMLTIDRYIAVCHPLKAQVICTLRRTYISIAAIVFLTFTFSIPRMFEFRLTTDEDPRAGFVHTPLIRNAGYTIGYRIVLFFLVMYLVPMVLLIVLNIRLMYTLRKSYADRHSMISNGNIQNRKGVIAAGQRISRSVSVIVATVVTVCVVCNITAMVTHIIWSLSICIYSLRFLEYYRRFLANISNVTVTINCAVNFVIYCFFSRVFRAGLLHMCTPEKSRSCCQRWRPEHHSDTSGHGQTSYTSLGILPMRVSFKTNKRNLQQKASLSM